MATIAFSAVPGVEPVEQGELTVDDGTRIPFQRFGRGSQVVVLANGIGVRWPGLAHQLAALADRASVLCWDYRGMGPSILGHPDADVSMARQACDVLALLDYMDVERAVFMGWSMGVQVSLEVLRARPERVSGFVAILGADGRPFRGAFPDAVAGTVEGLFAFALRHPYLAQGLLDLAVTVPEVAFRVLTAGVFVGRDADRSVFDGNVRWVAETDRRVYLRTMLALAEHDARDVLGTVRCPSLIVCGTRDHLTPPSVGRRMAAAIPGAEYRELAGGTHFALIEQPARLNGWLREFLDRIGPDLRR
ncbi:MAG: alpha/beta hydrolase [Deltaproteobacteria bacterium]|nr:alpha/beta hydrolase [Deltaproteobacteria bacterium]